MFTLFNRKLTLRVQQQVVELQIAVDDLALVQVLQPEDDTGRVEDGPRFRKHIGVDVHHQVTAGGVLHHEADVLLENKIKKD